MERDVRSAAEAGPSSAENETRGLPVSIVIKAAGAMLAAVVFVHLFAGPIEPVGAFAAHALLITGVYTIAFALTYLALQRLHRYPFVQAVPTPVLAAVLSALACLAGSLVLGSLKDAGGAVGAVIDVHDDANWLLKLLPLWLVLTAVLYQSERTRLIEAELRRLSHIRSHEQRRLPAPSAPLRTIEIGTAKSVTLPIDDVSHIMAVENYCEVHFVERAARKPLLVRATLSSVIDQLPADFARTHRSYVVNLACMDSIGKLGRAYAATMSDGQSVPVSRANADQVSARWREFLSASGAADRPE